MMAAAKSFPMFVSIQPIWYDVCLTPRSRQVLQGIAAYTVGSGITFAKSPSAERSKYIDFPVLPLLTIPQILQKDYSHEAC